MIRQKDYYTILGVPENASLEVIKKAYRKLALLYHPDVMKERVGDASAFLEIKEAYLVLSDTAKRQAYHWKVFQQNYQEEVVSIDSICREIGLILDLIEVLGPFRIDYDVLEHQLSTVLSLSNCRLIVASNEMVKRRYLFDKMLICCHPLPYYLAKKLFERMELIAQGEEVLEEQLVRFKKKQLLNDYWNRYQVLVAFCIVMLLFWLLF